MPSGKERVPKVLVDRVRSKLRDFPAVNELLDDQEESSDKQIARALADALRDFNSTPPILRDLEVVFAALLTEDGELKLGATFTTGGITHILVDKAIVEVLESVSLMMMRNDFEYTSGNTRVRLNDKWQHYERIMQRLEQRYELKRDQIKLQLNMEGAFSVVHSELFDGIRGDDNFIAIEVF